MTEKRVQTNQVTQASAVLALSSEFSGCVEMKTLDDYWRKRDVTNYAVTSFDHVSPQINVAGDARKDFPAGTVLEVSGSANNDGYKTVIYTEYFKSLGITAIHCGALVAELTPAGVVHIAIDRWTNALPIMSIPCDDPAQTTISLAEGTIASITASVQVSYTGVTSNPVRVFLLQYRNPGPTGGFSFTSTWEILAHTAAGASLYNSPDFPVLELQWSGEIPSTGDYAFVIAVGTDGVKMRTNQNTYQDGVDPNLQELGIAGFTRNPHCISKMTAVIWQ